MEERHGKLIWAEIASLAEVKVVEELQKKCTDDESIKLIHAGRHGEGEHNALAKKYGGDYDKANRLEPIVDPGLTNDGLGQASGLASAFTREIEENEMPEPEVFYTSPLKRCIQTATTTWKNPNLPAQVEEEFCEHVLLHSWNQRSLRSEIEGSYPSLIIPPDFTEEDEVYKRQEKIGSDEIEDELVKRAGRGLDKMMTKSWDKTYISLTAHSGALRGVWKTVGAPERSLKIGEMNVLPIKVKRVRSIPPSTQGYITSITTDVLGAAST